ncbi:MAG: amidohydrolase family protein [Candidatus Thorarchaeota archaeon]|nr:MAG: amidohydrolase family protein [Candidatus Thorarchaeota archaeon]
MSERTLIVNGLVVTCDKSNTIIEKGYVLVEDKRIVKVGDGKPPEKVDNVVDAKGKVVIPGIVTAHTHLYGILLRGASLKIDPPVDFAQVLQRVWWPVDEALSPDDAWASALSASADMLRNGSTFFADTYSGPNSIESTLDRIAEATERIGIRSLLAFEATERNTPEEGARGIEENIRFAESVAKASDLTSLMMSVHASFTVSDELILEAVKRAAGLKIPLTIHTSEGLVDLYHNLERYGERTVERLSRLGALGNQTVLAHCVHVDSNELDLIAKSGTSVAHNPMSNMLNAVGTSPVPDMLRRSITVGLGNDGWIYDPFENMRCALTVHRLEARNPSAIGPDEVFRMATIDGARCYGMDNEIGSIEQGKSADIVILDGTRVPTPLNSSSVIGHLVNTFGGRDVSDVFVNGVHVIKDQRLTRISDEEVSEISIQSAEGLWSRL